MRRVVFGLALVVAAVAWQPHDPPPTLQERRANLALVRVGMAPAEVRRLLGEPDHIARQLLYRRYVEQWGYTDPPARVEFDCVLGRDPHVRAIRVPPRPKP